MQRHNSLWQEKLDAVCAPHLRDLLTIDLVRHATSGDLDANRLRHFFLETGVGIISRFPEWLENLISRTPRSLKRSFWERNLETEERHWQDWLIMSAEYSGLSHFDFRKHTLGSVMANFSNFLTGESLRENPGAGLATINLVVETGAARITEAIAPAILPSLSPTGGRWLRAHASGSAEHARVTKHLLQIEEDRDPRLGDKLGRLVPLVYRFYREALASAY